MQCYAIVMLGYYRVINYQRILLIQGKKKKTPQTANRSGSRVVRGHAADSNGQMGESDHWTHLALSGAY